MTEEVPLGSETSPRISPSGLAQRFVSHPRDSFRAMDESAAGTLERIIASQTAWATRNGVPLNASSRCANVEDNLFSPLNEDTAAEFGGGAGDELGTPESPGSMASLRSSSALAVNVFDAWRGRDLSPLAPLLAASEAAARVRFEVTYPTGLRGIPPHLDVVIDHPGGSPVAIESKFTEIYAPAHNDFRPSYFEDPDLWIGFGRTHDVALRIAEGTEWFERLGAAQLIKHALGLKHAHGSNGFRLLYLWYEWPGEAAETHKREVQRFAESIGGDFDFAAVTYQDLFGDLRDLPEPGPGYIAYLANRYFSGG